MDEWRIETCERAERYAQRNGRMLIGQLGYGYDGTVFATDGQSAIKTLRFERLYHQERDIYQRLHSLSIVEVAGFSVPQLINFDQKHLSAIHLSSVTRGGTCVSGAGSVRMIPLSTEIGSVPFGSTFGSVSGRLRRGSSG